MTDKRSTILCATVARKAESGAWWLMSRADGGWRRYKECGNSAVAFRRHVNCRLTMVLPALPALTPIPVLRAPSC